MLDPDRLREFIDNAGLSYKENSRSYVFTCPKCRKDQKLYMEKRTGRFICFFCSEIEGYRGKPEFALSDLAAVPLAEVKEFLYGALHGGTAFEIDLQLSDYFGDEDELDTDAIEIPTVQYPYDFYPIDHPFSERGAEYLAGRGIPLDIAKEYHLAYAPVIRRVIFPVEIGDRLVGWQERLIINHHNWDEENEVFRDSPKMVSSKDIPTAHVVMFANRMQNSEHVVVCEGPIDAIKAHLCGGNVATMGKAIGRGQVDVIRDPSKLTRAHVGSFQYAGIKRVYLALDPDAARETSRLIREFSDLEVYLMTPPRGKKDLGEMSFSEVLAAFRAAERVGPGRLILHFG